MVRPQLSWGVIQQQANVLNRADLESIHTFASQHRNLLSLSKHAGCFHCCEIFPPSEIVEWTDEPRGETEEASDGEGVTALCPRCGIDASPAFSIFLSVDRRLARRDASSLV